MASVIPSSATVTLEVAGERRTFRLSDLEAFSLVPRDPQELDGLLQPPEVTDTVTVHGGQAVGRITRGWHLDPPRRQERPRTTREELYHLGRVWLASEARSGSDDAGLGFLNEEARRHGESDGILAYVLEYEDSRARQAEEDREYARLWADDDPD